MQGCDGVQNMGRDGMQNAMCAGMQNAMYAGMQSTVSRYTEMCRKMITGNVQNNDTERYHAVPKIDGGTNASAVRAASVSAPPAASRVRWQSHPPACAPPFFPRPVLFHSSTARLSVRLEASLAMAVQAVIPASLRMHYSSIYDSPTHIPCISSLACTFRTPFALS